MNLRKNIRLFLLTKKVIRNQVIRKTGMPACPSSNILSIKNYLICFGFISGVGGIGGCSSIISGLGPSINSSGIGGSTSSI